ncbi:hypothetical protein VOLCADRAFT_103633 [Volvox carteri f. nagariensis]|uniref:COX assembly mitochondrial protein n=1 Tax=Volvox carteri f. nagariensis TaxID=3068 RepID=D8TNI5_VOLCA|nr:uncharacterized protein VOLCADRAFT_103633 [Volvox carteri f. nagariensis]EFJ50846.1 hypothetical protein VOLCADRAFT_103633 [Volvox carteri f. nagariensis]|eukprot:XP_002947858.1 hypothetical protein VOLCADRAFT_103633 [Volvox carteri f. nagariensis]
MGHDMRNIREANLSSVTKRLVHAETPCAAELGALMDCMKRAGPDGDSECARQRAALSACAGKHARAPRTVSAEKRRIVTRLQGVGEAGCRLAVQERAESRGESRGKMIHRSDLHSAYSAV